MFELPHLHTVLRYLHVGAGFTGLLGFWIPVFARKGSRLHIQGGRVFAFSAYVVGYSALLSSAWAIVAPVNYLTARGAPVAEALDRAGEVRFFFAILGYLSILVLAGIQTGIRVLRTKNNPELFASPNLRGWNHGVGLGGLLLVVCGLVSFIGSGFEARYLIWIGLGALGIHDWRDAGRFLANPRPTPMAWWYKHMESMIGCGIAFHTAFFVFGFGRLLPGGIFVGPLALLPWILPTAVGVPLLAKWVRHYRMQFGEPVAGRGQP